MNVLILDGYNILHRARSGFSMGDYPVVYNALRGIKALVEQFKPAQVYFTLEGSPKRALALLPEYKANRIVDQSTSAGVKKHAENVEFHRQKDLIVDLLSRHVPVSVIRHPDFEADDLIYNLVNSAPPKVRQFTVVSSDSDFVQLLQKFNNVRLYNPVKKQFVEAPEYDYVHWKALRGDPSDNIPGLPGVSDAKATRMLTKPGAAVEFMGDEALQETWQRNIELIRFKAWTPEEVSLTESSAPVRDWDAVATKLKEWGFESMLKPTYFDKFVTTFDRLWVPKEGNVTT